MMKNKTFISGIILLVFFHIKGFAQSDTGKVYLDKLRIAVEKEKDPARKEKSGLAYLKTMKDLHKLDNDLQDYVLLDIGLGFAKAADVAKAVAYANKLKTDGWAGEGRSRIALALIKKDKIAAAEVLLKKAVEATAPFLTVERKTNYEQFAAASGYKYYCTDLADVLYRRKKYTEALKYIKIAHQDFNEVKGSVNTIYVLTLMKLDRYDKAFDMLDEAIKNGQGTEGLKVVMKEVYSKAKGNLTGYETYAVNLQQQLAVKMKQELAAKMIKEKVPGFVLKDLDGNIVSSDSLKGKVVVLDFWATWCGPCKASFPAMKLAVERYKNDPKVKFYFIHTMEYNEHATEEARKYITDMKYPFTVLMDLKEKGVKGNKVVDSFKTSMIPAKFVIDGNGDLRFKMIGYHEGDDATLEEITAMIELAK